MSDRLHQYRRALKEPFRYDVAFYAGLYIEELEAEVERLRAVRRALVRDNRDKTNRVRALEADPRMALTVEDLEDLVVHVLSQSDPDYWEKEYEIATRVGEALDAKEDDSE